MQKDFGNPARFGLSNHGLFNLGSVYWDLRPPALVEEVLRRKEGILSQFGATVVCTGSHTGRSPDDKFIVKYETTETPPFWWGKINRPISPANAGKLCAKLTGYFQGKDVFVQNLAVGASPQYRLPIRIITETAWHSLFAQALFLRLPVETQVAQTPLFTLIHAPGFNADPDQDGTNSNAFIILDFSKGLVLIGGTAYAGEIKKAIFTIMNYLMPPKNVLPMHCSANVGSNKDVALFFGLSGTGKTTLSSDPERQLVGDDEHGWSEEGIFNFEGGCYAKTIRLKQEFEPLIWDASRRFGTVLENVPLDPATRIPNFNDDSLTENTRAAYPIDYLPNVIIEGQAAHPSSIFFLTADAFGVLPPLARLTPEQALYYFLSGYTSKLAGTEQGLAAEPQATFSTCFGAPFLPLNPGVYARLLGEKIARHQVQVWLINTGWTGGPYGTGRRIPLPYTRAMVRSVLNLRLNEISLRSDPFFGLSVPLECPGVPTELLNPRQTWPNPSDYDQQARTLVKRFQNNFSQFGQIPAAITSAGPLQI